MAGAVSVANCHAGISDILWSHNRKPEVHFMKQPALLLYSCYTYFKKSQSMLVDLRFALLPGNLSVLLMVVCYLPWGK